jgi:hypothetical protein
VAVRHPDWLLGFLDETWGSRLACPALHAWADHDQPRRLVEQTVGRDDPDPKALASYGVLLRQVSQPERVWLRFVDGRPVSAIIEQFLDWCGTRLHSAAGGGRARVGADLGQRFLARESARARLDPGTQPEGQAPRARRPHLALPPAGQESMAQSR